MAARGVSQDDIALALNVSKATLAKYIMLGDETEVKEAYLNGKRLYASNLVDNLMLEAAAPLHDDPKLANAAVQRQKLIVDTAKWIGAKLLPRVYGDNLHIDHAHTGTVELSPLAQLRQLESKGASTEVKPLQMDGASIDNDVSDDDCF